jgi:DNA-binding MarR family transcriptional regulator
MVLRRWHEQVEEALRDIPQGSRGYHVLSVVVHDEVPTQGALASRLAIDRSVMTYLLDDLETAGLLERQLDPRDRRARRIVPTEQGRKTLAEAEGRVAIAEDNILGGLPEPERSLFRLSAERAAEAIQAAEPGTNPCLAVQEVMDSTPDQVAP